MCSGTWEPSDTQKNESAKMLSSLWPADSMPPFAHGQELCHSKLVQIPLVANSPLSPSALRIQIYLHHAVNNNNNKDLVSTSVFSIIYKL